MIRDEEHLDWIIGDLSKQEDMDALGYTFDALRAVARAADFICPPKPVTDYGQGIFALRQALDALPRWCVEEEK